MWWIPAALATEIAPGVEFRTVEHDNRSFRVVTVDLQRADLALVGLPSGPHTVEELERLHKGDLPAKDAAGKGWVAATNAGLYHSVTQPVGLFVADGIEHAPLELKTGTGNFWLLPNGVFTIDALGARVVDSTAYKPSGKVQLATQSGPALLLEGALNQRFLPTSTSEVVRNAVGVSDAHTVHLVLSVDPVRFYTLATLFRDVLHCTDALYLDGNISGMWGTALPTSTTAYSYAGFLVVIPR